MGSNHLLLLMIIICNVFHVGNASTCMRVIFYHLYYVVSCALLCIFVCSHTFCSLWDVITCAIINIGIMIFAMRSVIVLMLTVHSSLSSVNVYYQGCLL